MKKEDVLKLFWRERRNSVRFDGLFFFLGIGFMAAIPQFLPSEKGVGEWMLMVFLGAIACGLLLISGYSLWKTYRTVRKVKAGDFEVIEDTVVAKLIEKGIFGRTEHLVCFGNLDPKHPQCRLHNSLFMSEEDYEAFQVGDKSYFLCVNLNGKLDKYLLRIIGEEGMFNA